MSVASGALSRTADGQPGYAVRVSPGSALLIRALTEHADEVELVDIAQFAVAMNREKRKNRTPFGNRPLPASIEFVCPDEVVQNLKGEPRERGKLVGVWIPAVVLDDLTRVIETPAEAAANGAPLIVMP